MHGQRIKKRFHSKPLSNLQILKLQEFGDYTTWYHTNRPLGKEKVHRICKAGSASLGLKDTSRFYGHALCSLFFIKIASCVDLNAKAMLEATRHFSLNATLTYVETSAKKEVRNLEALEFTLPVHPGVPVSTTKTRVASIQQELYKEVICYIP